MQTDSHGIFQQPTAITNKCISSKVDELY